MQIAFRVDVSPQIGTDHLIRCRTLAIASWEQGATIQFIGRDHPG